MAKRGRKKKFKLKLNVRPETVRSIVAILLMLGAGLVVISALLSGSDSTSLIQTILKRGFGYSQILLAPILFVSGLLLLNNIEWKIAELRVAIAFLIILIAGSGLMHSFYSADKAAEAARLGKGGGLIGYTLASILSDIISIYGAIFVFIGLIVLAGILLFDKPVEEIAGAYARFKEARTSRKGNKEGEIGEESEATEEEDIVIKSAMDDNKQREIEIINKDEKPFEIIPTMNEPQGGLEAVAEATTDEKDSSKKTNTLIPTLPYSDKVYELPPLDLLQEPPDAEIDRGDVKQRAKIIEDTLKSFGIDAEVKEIKYGPTVTQYALETAAGTKITKISNLQYDLALALASPTGSVRIEAPIPGRSLVGIEVPNNNRVTVFFKDVLQSEAMKNEKSKTAIVLGQDVGGKAMSYDISKMPHLLIAGATGSGKSVFIHNLMFSILFRATPQECKFILIDPKRVELVLYNGIPHLLSPVVTDIEKAPAVFKWAVQEMERRYKLLEAAKVRNIKDYNKKSGFQALPYIVIVVDELAEIMVVDQASVEKSIVRIAQLARAVGIHLVLALQRPTTNIITGLIKANIPCRIAFNVTSGTDSRVIIDQTGAEKLLGSGDMLFVPPDDSKPRRIQGAWVQDGEIERTINFLKKTGMEPEYSEDIFEVKEPGRSIAAGGDDVDELFEDALEVIRIEDKASASLLQRRLSIGYSRAARIIDEMEAKGIVGPARGSKPREILRGGGDSGTLDEIQKDLGV